MNRKQGRKRILLYSPIYFPDIGGPAVQAKFLTDLLIEEGYEIIVLKYSQSAKSNSAARIESLNWNPNPNFIGRIYRWIFGPILSLFYLLRFKPSLVLINSVFWNGMIMGYICKLLRIPSVIKFTGDWVFESTQGQKDLPVNLRDIYTRNFTTRVLLLVEKYLLEKFTVIWVISKFRYENVLTLTQKPQIWLQRNFHDLPKYELIENQRFYPPYIFITTARLIPHKRIDVIIKTISKLPKECKLIVIGDGSELTALKALAQELSISNRVIFLGEISSNLLYHLLSKSSAYLSWSAEEGAPNSFIEALNFGLPIVSANVGGISEMFSYDTKAAKLIDPNSPEDLKICLEHLVESPNYLMEMSRAALIESVNFTKDSNKQSFLQLFSRLISNA